MADIRPKDLLPTAALPADDDYLLLDGATAGTRKALARGFLHGVSVAAFGAVGDGTTNDSAAFANATAAALASSVPVLIIPKGTFNVPTWSYNTTGNLTVIGQGPDTLLVGNGQNLFAPAGGNLTLRDFRVEGIARLLHFSNTATPMGRVVIENIDATVTTVLVGGSSPTLEPTDHLIVRGCKIDGGGVGSGINFENSVERIDISQNEMSNLGVAGVRIGNNSLELAESRKDVRIYRNWIRNIYRPTAGSAYGIIVHAVNVNIDENIIDDVDGQFGSDVEGIYVKATYGSINKNRLYNAGGHEASITLKGDKRDAPSTPQGFNFEVIGNYITFSDARVLHTAFTGIQVNNERVIVANNIVERLSKIVDGTDIVPLEIHGFKGSGTLADLLVHGNQFIGVSNISLVANGTEKDRVQFDGNIMVFNHFSVNANVNITTTSSFVRFINNQCRHQGQRAMRVYPLPPGVIARIEVLNNSFLGCSTANGGGIQFRFANDDGGTPAVGASYRAVKGNFFERPFSGCFSDEWTAPTISIFEGNSYSDKASDTVDLLV